MDSSYSSPLMKRKRQSPLQQHQQHGEEDDEQRGRGNNYNITNLSDSETNHQHQHQRLHLQEEVEVVVEEGKPQPQEQQQQQRQEEDEDSMDCHDSDEHVNNTIIDEAVKIEKLKPEAAPAAACGRTKSTGCAAIRKIRSSTTITSGSSTHSDRMELLNWHSRQEPSGKYSDDDDDNGYVADGDVSCSTSSYASSSSSTVTSTQASSPSSSPFSSPSYSPMEMYAEDDDDDDDDDDEVEEDDRKPTAAILASFSSTSTSSSSSSTTILSGKGVATANVVKTPTLLDVGADVIANVLSFVGPAEALRLLTVPICTQWRTSYTANQDLWRTLCKSEPFSATLEDGHQGSRSKKNENKGRERDEDDSASDDDDDDDDDDSFCSLDGYSDSDDEDDDSSGSHNVLGEYRLMYTSFVRCMNYLNRIHDDAKKGRPLSGGSYNITSTFPTFGVTKGLKKFLSRSENHALKSVIGGGNRPSHHPSTPIGVSADGREVMHHLPATKVAAMTKKTETSGSPNTAESTEKPKFGNSMITARLLGPSSVGAPSHLNLPRTCAIYSIVNWIVAHPEVEGIQIMCVASLPTLLEDEQQRLTAQRLRLIEVVLSSMMRFPDSLKLHIAAFHTMVLLARPLGGREGMLFDNSMANSTRGLGLTSKSKRFSNGKATIDPSHLSDHTGMSILIDSMNRFQHEERLQAMACWAMVNIALVPSQKSMLMRLNGIQAAVNALVKHPKSFDVQFRALFALINLVVPCKDPEPFDEESGRTERDVLDEWSAEIARLVVAAMENFCNSERILNRACLVLHNLSQSHEYVASLLWTPHLYQMLEWCMANHPTDNVLRRSATSTLNRIQLYLSQNQGERQRFLQYLAQHQLQEAQQRHAQEQQDQGEEIPVPSAA